MNPHNLLSEFLDDLVEGYRSYKSVMESWELLGSQKIDPFKGAHAVKVEPWMVDRVFQLDSALLSRMEVLFDQDFKNVRIHLGPVANGITGQRGASAVTIGNDIYFAEGTYEPHREEGLILLAHELEHVKQFASGQSPRTGEDRDSLEGGAYRIEEMVKDNFHNLETCSLSDVYSISDNLKKDYHDVDNKAINSCMASNFRIYRRRAEESERAFRTNQSAFFTYLRDQSIDKLEEILQELLLSLQLLDAPVMVNYLDHLPNNQIIRGSNYSEDEHVRHFKRAVKNEAIKVLNSNRVELINKKDTYMRTVTDNHLNKELFGLNENLKRYRDLEAQLKEKKRQQIGLYVSIGSTDMTGYTSSMVQEYTDSLRSSIQEVTNEIEVLEEACDEILRKKPELGVIRDRFEGTDGLQTLQRELDRGFTKALEAMDEVYTKLVNDDIPLEVLEPVIAKVKSDYGVLPAGEEGNDAYSLSVNSWISDRETWDAFIKITGTVVSLGCAIALFITGVGTAAAIAIGFAGAAVGGAVSGYNFERANDMNDIAVSQDGTTGQLITDPEAVKKEYAWAIADLVLAGVDLGGAIFDVAKVMKLVKQFDNVSVGSKVVLQLDDLSEEAVGSVSRIFNGLEETKQKELVEYLGRHKNTSKRLEVIEEIGLDEVLDPKNGSTIENRIWNITARELADNRMKNADIIRRLESAPPSSKGVYHKDNLVELRSFQDDVNMVLRREGVSYEDFKRMKELPVSQLNRNEALLMQRIRDMVPAPTQNTLLQKVVKASDIEGYLKGDYTQIGGCVTDAADMRGVSGSSDVFETLRLDYGEIEFSPEMESYGVIRFKTKKTGELSNAYSPELGGENLNRYPATGHGFLSSRNGQNVPESLFPDKSYFDPIDGAELYKVDKSGKETLVAVFDDDFGRFIPVDEFTREAIQ